jgi:hypothetical protein
MPDNQGCVPINEVRFRFLHDQNNSLYNFWVVIRRHISAQVQKTFGKKRWERSVFDDMWCCCIPTRFTEFNCEIFKFVSIRLPEPDPYRSSDSWTHFLQRFIRKNHWVYSTQFSTNIHASVCYGYGSQPFRLQSKGPTARPWGQFKPWSPYW